jgi:hypothetical protein
MYFRKKVSGGRTYLQIMESWGVWAHRRRSLPISIP